MLDDQILIISFIYVLSEEERIMTCIPPNPRRVGYIDPTHGPLDGPLYMGSIYSNNNAGWLVAGADLV